MSSPDPIRGPVPFAHRHHGDGSATSELLRVAGYPSLDSLIEAAVPASIRRAPMSLPAALSEDAALAELRVMARENKVFRSFIGQGYHDTFTPAVIQRTIFENPGWYTAYTPYQAEISQGRLEALLNFQTMVCELTGMEIANASMLDEGTAAAEAMTLCHRVREGRAIFVSDGCHPQTIEVVKTRARPLGIEVVVGDHRSAALPEGCFAVLVQYPDTRGSVHDLGPFLEKAKAAGALGIVATDLLALTLLRPPGEFGADVAVGSAQRFGVPLGFGGPHAGFFATRDVHKRQMPGRLVGVSKDAQGRPALRLALATREQHIRREKATSNICTAQVLLAVMASMYAVYHGPAGLRGIAARVKSLAGRLAGGLRRCGVNVNAEPVFDTLTVTGVDAARVHAAAEAAGINLRRVDAGTVGISLDETTGEDDVRALLALFGDAALPESAPGAFDPPLARASGYLAHPVFNRFHTEHGMLRYIKRLEARDITLCQSMISLGSCTMKLNAASEMFPVSWPEFSRLHPFAPAGQTRGYARLFAQLEAWLAEITGLSAVSLQPNAGSQGEFAGLLAIRAWHEARGQGHRDICLIPASAHGTNPASAVTAGLKVVVVATDERGNIDVADLRAKAAANAGRLAAFMVTYPSTHGVFEGSIREICSVIHEHGGQVYMDGANMNAQVGLTSPGAIGADVCHLNLHKTFCIPHGGGGPGVGPIAVAAHLAPYLPGRGVGPVSAAAWGSASILVIPWMYIRMMGADGLTDASRLAILNANYVAARLREFFPVLYRGESGAVAHECIVDLRSWKKDGIEAEDVAKRLMDYGFHAPTLSFPVPGTFMIEPTESESREELDRFCDALVAIHGEMKAAVAAGNAAASVLKHSPHTALDVCSGAWDRPYTREQAAFPAPWTRESKFWPAVGRVDGVYGDRHLMCTCAGMENHA
jgi:glycine dehydrogenase